MAYRFWIAAYSYLFVSKSPICIISCVYTDASDRALLQPPRKLQLSVYETRYYLVSHSIFSNNIILETTSRFFSDHKLGDLDLSLSSLTDERCVTNKSTSMFTTFYFSKWLQITLYSFLTCSALRDWLPLSSDKGTAW